MDINRKTAYLVLVDVESKKAYSNLALNHQMVINKPNAPGFVRELVYGVLENKLTLDYYIDLLVKDGVKSLKTPELIILRMGGEGLFNTVITGPGHVWLQTMPLSNVAGVLRAYLPTSN